MTSTPCPFCGPKKVDVILNRFNGNYKSPEFTTLAWCVNCFAEGPNVCLTAPNGTVEQALGAWSRRFNVARD